MMRITLYGLDGQNRERVYSILYMSHCSKIKGTVLQEQIAVYLTDCFDVTDE